MRIRPTELGCKGGLLLCGLVVAFLAAAYSNLFFLIIAFCAALGALGLWWTIQNVRHVEVRLLDAPAAPAGAARQLHLAVRTSRGRAFDLGLAIDAGGARTELTHLTALHDEVRLTATLPAQPRGVQSIASVRCSSRFPFGLFQATRRLPVTAELVTYPAPPKTTPAELAAFGLEARSGGRSAAVAGLRPFRAGDSPAEVHWKATARRGVPIVKERERGGDQVVDIVVDRRCGDSEEQFEAMLSRATAALLVALERERPVQLRSQGEILRLEPGLSPDDLFRWLANATALPSDAPAPTRVTEVARV